ncbi:cyclase family protein [Ramlibacter henchirensis]|uniref:Cyclase family protein n=1 Tax=Ramlibacter henchirensis TaxID=204072 RepID=A0A4Z0C592_9BURK|nr:cyclase family protein [Ramlibacter henchirensis]TFZ05620.1 cyclase family protein [Ramlibacter henchirensis]
MRMPKTIRLAAAGLALAFAGSAFPQQAPAAPDWCRSKFGPNDEIGAANLLTPELALAATRLVRTGKTYALGGETNAKTPAFAPRTWSLTVLQPGQAGGGSLGSTKTNYNDDIYTGWVGTGTQIDGLGHIGVDNVYYNCLRNSDFVQASGLTKLGIEKVPPFVTRGVVLDMAAFFGVEMMREGQAFNRAEIEEQAKRQGIEIRRGDVVLFHTGWQKIAASDPARFVKAEPGLGRDGAQWLASKQVIAVGADTWALEVIPFEQGAGVFEVHQILIPRNGIYILENIQTEQLVKDRAWEFMFVLGHSRITGGVQAIINPVAIR